MSLNAIAPTTPLIAGEVEFTENLSPEAMIIYLQSRLDGLDEQIDEIFNDQKRQQKAQAALSALKTDLNSLDEKAATAGFDPAESTPSTQTENNSPSIASQLFAVVPPSGMVGTRFAPGGQPSYRPMTGTGGPAPVIATDNTSQGAGEVPGASAAPANSTPGFKARLEKDLEVLRAIDPWLANKIEVELKKPGQLLQAANVDTYQGQQVSAAKELLNGIGKDLESQAAMNMIHLQSLMSARQTAVQLATNLVSSLGESLKAVAGNVGKS